MSELIVFCSCPNESVASRLAEMLVTEKAAACVTLLPQARSFYLWENTLEKSNEVLLLIKTTEQAYPHLENRIVQNHPYQVPEIIACDVVNGYKPYLQWVNDATNN